LDEAMISVVIPTHNAASHLPAALQSLFDAAIDGLVSEVIVADCGSTDGTLDIADDAGATVIEAGCGQQLLAGAQAARKPWLLFLKPCATMEKGWEKEARAFIAKGETGAAAFRFRVAGAGIRPRLREAAAAIRARAFRQPDCCNGLLIPAKLLDAVGAASTPPLEEEDLIKRLGRGRVVMLTAAVIASGARA
jgi:glycosyltransferase involved in cell wall biosynthesis